MERYMPAEWECDSAVLMALPHKDTDWNYILDEVTRCYFDIVDAVTRERPVILLVDNIESARSIMSGITNPDNLYYCQIKTNDTWARDFGPITVIENGRPLCLDFSFNGWGLKFPACFDNLITSRLKEASVLIAPVENRLGFVLEGGSIESDGAGTVFTTSECLLSKNRNGGMNKEQIETYLKDALGAERIMWIDYGYLAGDDTDSHIDTLVRIAPNDTLLYVKCSDPSDEHFEELNKMESQLKEFRTSDGMPYNLIALPMPDAIVIDGERLPATYANFLVTPTSVSYPTYGQKQNDELAGQILKIAFPNHNIRGIGCIPLIRQHGSLHCITMQMPKKVFPL